uniref:Serpentine receptor class gamma n=1 Tax=Panagrellus redivivus TaxID=6233 RepID=A0A7E4VCQ5_PANRE
MSTCAIICIVLTIGSVVATRFNTTDNGSSILLKIERRLLLQCSISTFLFCITIFCDYVYTSTATIETFFYKDEKRVIEILVATSNMCVEIIFLIDALMLLMISFCVLTDSSKSADDYAGKAAKYNIIPARVKINKVSTMFS